MTLKPAFLSPGWWSLKRLAILIGFLLTVIGALGPHFYVGPVEDGAADVDQAAKLVSARIDNLRAAQSQYLLFQQMGVLVYALNATGVAAAGSSQATTLNRLYQLSLLDRSSAVRQMIGELALARQLSYRETSDQYGALIAAARKDFSLQAFQAVDDFETDAMGKADAWMAKMQQALFDAQRAKSGLDATAGRRKLQLLVVMTLGSTLLLAANLLSERPAEFRRFTTDAGGNRGRRPARRPGVGTGQGDRGSRWENRRAVAALIERGNAVSDHVYNMCSALRAIGQPNVAGAVVRKAIERIRRDRTQILDAPDDPVGGVGDEVAAGADIVGLVPPGNVAHTNTGRAMSHRGAADRG